MGDQGQHWAAKYVGKKWSHEQDCGFWFRKIQHIEFALVVPVVCVSHGGTMPVLQYAQSIRDAKLAAVGWRQTKSPRDGDAVFLSQRNRPHHIGIVAIVAGKLHVLHAIKNSGVILTDKLSLAVNGWKIESFWTYGN